MDYRRIGLVVAGLMLLMLFVGCRADETAHETNTIETVCRDAADPTACISTISSYPEEVKKKSKFSKATLIKFAVGAAVTAVDKLVESLQNDVKKTQGPSNSEALKHCIAIFGDLKNSLVGISKSHNGKAARDKAQADFNVCKHVFNESNLLTVAEAVLKAVGALAALL